MRFDGDHTPDEFGKARRMEDVAAPTYGAERPSAAEYSDECPHGMRDLENGGCTCADECALGYRL